MKIARLVAVAGFIIILPYLPRLVRNSSAGEPQVIRELRAKAEAGDVSAMRDLANLYAAGVDGMAQDVGKAVTWLTRAVEKGDPQGMIQLGTLYIVGSGMRPDPDRGVALIKKAAEGGFSEAQLTYGIFLMNGNWVKANPEEGEKWIRRAAEQGFPLACSVAGSLILSRWREGDDAAERDRGVEWLLRGIRRSTPNIWNFLAEMYLTGNFVPEDRALARLWFERAARKDFELAQLTLGLCYLEGVGGPKDPGKAKRWLTDAYVAGNKAVADALKLIPADVQAKGDTPVVVDWDGFLREFSASPEKADEKYLTEIIDLSSAANASRLRLQKIGDYLLVSLDGASMKLRMLPAVPGELASVRIGDPLRCRYQGLKDDQVMLESCSRITATDIDTAQRDGLILTWNLTKRADDSSLSSISPANPGVANRETFTGVWEGTYSEAGKQGGFPLRIDTASVVELDDVVKMNVVEAHVEDGNATVHAIWPNDPLERELFFTGRLKDGVWDGTMVGMGEGKVNYRGVFILRRAAR